MSLPIVDFLRLELKIDSHPAKVDKFEQEIKRALLSRIEEKFGKKDPESVFPISEKAWESFKRAELQ